MRLKDKLERFFNEYREYSRRIQLLHGSHLLLIVANSRPSAAVRRFWNPYFEVDGATRLVFGTPILSVWGQYLIRSARANGPKEKHLVAELLTIDKASLQPSYSFVTSGVVEAMARLFECFSLNGSRSSAVS